MAEDRGHALQPGDAIVVRTPDRRSFYGRLVEWRGSSGVVRLDTGWVTTYPETLIFPDDRRATSPCS